MMKFLLAKQMTPFKFLAMLFWGLSLQVTDACHAQAASKNRYFSVRTEIRSWIPGETLESYKLHSTGSCGRGGSVGMTIPTGEKKVNVGISCLPTSREEFVVEVKLRTIPTGKNLVDTEPDTRKLNMLDLRSQRIEIARDSNGRVFELTLVPEVVVLPKPKTFKVSNLKLQEWDFNLSPVILNDQNYVGQMGVSGGNLAGVDIAGYTTCEFSLIPWKGSQPTGTLENGVLKLNGEEISLMISGVRNGASRQILKGGPFLVWTKWTKPKYSKKESQALIGQQIQELQKRIEAGDDTITPEDLRRVKEFVDSGKPVLMGSFSRDLKPSEIIDPAD
ncbi:MAG: hypothetical protein ACIAZJ_00755 [Gimesia chilikensis]|uniref:hypothetical protein n=1 Tax=Gimesia chilikensis TaxID=2605989 RepID=UPI0037B62296